MYTEYIHLRSHFISILHLEPLKKVPGNSPNISIHILHVNRNDIHQLNVLYHSPISSL